MSPFLPKASQGFVWEFCQNDPKWTYMNLRASNKYIFQVDNGYFRYILGPDIHRCRYILGPVTSTYIRLHAVRCSYTHRHEGQHCWRWTGERCAHSCFYILDTSLIYSDVFIYIYIYSTKCQPKTTVCTIRSTSSSQLSITWGALGSLWKLLGKLVCWHVPSLATKGAGAEWW